MYPTFLFIGTALASHITMWHLVNINKIKYVRVKRSSLSLLSFCSFLLSSLFPLLCLHFRFFKSPSFILPFPSSYFYFVGRFNPVFYPYFKEKSHFCTKKWFDMIWYDMIWYDMIWYDMIWYDMIWYDVIWYDMICLFFLLCQCVLFQYLSCILFFGIIFIFTWLLFELSFYLLTHLSIHLFIRLFLYHIF